MSKRSKHVRRLYKRVASEYHKRECIICGTVKNLSVHHIDESWQNNNPENLCWL